MAQNLQVAGAASLPFEDGTSTAQVNLALTLPFTSRADFVKSITGAVSDQAVDFGALTVPGAKGVVVKALSGACTIKFNGGLDAWPIDVGGYFLWVNPTRPFPTAALITTTADARILFIAVG